MRVCLWHGWLLDGTGSNVYTAKAAEAMRRAGHDVLLVCQEPHPERLGFVDEHGAVDACGVHDLETLDAPRAPGRAVVLRPSIGDLLPVFVTDEYEGFRVKRFVELSGEELDAYLSRNVEALREAVAWHGSEAVVAGHGVPGPVVALRALGPGAYAAKIHGSDYEYAIKLQERYANLARQGLEGAVAVTGTSDDVLARMVETIPSIAGRVRKVTPGVDVDAFRPAPRREALLATADAIEANGSRARGRAASLDDEVVRALGDRDAARLDALAARYDQMVPDPLAPERLRTLASLEGPLFGYLGKLIPQKGVQRVIEATALLPNARAAIVGFGTHREWLHALVAAIDRGDAGAIAWLAGRMELETPVDATGIASRVTFTGFLDHRYAPGVVAALDVLVVPSIGPEAFGMVAAEVAAGGALPLVARHSGLAEVAAALEGAAGRPGLFSFEPGSGGGRRLAGGIRSILALSEADRAGLREAVAGFVRSEWTWERTAERLLDAALAVRGSKP